MKLARILLSLLFMTIGLPALGQVGIIDKQTPIIGGTSGQCLSRGSNGLVLFIACTTGGVTPSGTLTLNEVIVGNGGSSIKASGVQLITTMCTGCYVGNPTTTDPNVPQITPYIAPPDGTALLPSHTFKDHLDSGLSYSTGLVFSLGGKRGLFVDNIGSSGNYVRIIANETPSVAAISGAGTNLSLQLFGAVGGGVDILSTTSTQYITRFLNSGGSGAGYNYLKVSSAANGSPVKIETAINTSGSDTNVDLLFSLAGTGVPIMTGTTGNSPGWYSRITGDSVPRVRIGLNSADVASLGMGSGSATRDAFIERAGAANIRFGAPDAASPVAQTTSVQNVVAGTTDTAGVNRTYAGSQGTGTGAGGSHIFTVAPAGSTASTQNALATALTIDSTKLVSFSGGAGFKSINETVPTPSITSNVLTIDLSTGTIFKVANTANISTFTISNAVAAKGNSFILMLTANGTGFTQNWGTVRWSSATAPVLTTTNNQVDILTFITYDGGTTWFGLVGGYNL